MKVSVNDIELFTLSAIHKQVICNDIDIDVLEKDLKRRLQWVLIHKYEQSFKRLKNEWDSKLAANGVKMIPTDADEYASLVFTQSNYLDRKAKDLLNVQVLPPV